jgi:hypothetical protein
MNRHFETPHALSLIDLHSQTYRDLLTLGLPDTLRLRG